MANNAFSGCPSQSPWPFLNDPLDNFFDDASTISSQQRRMFNKSKVPLPDFLSNSFNPSTATFNAAPYQIQNQTQMPLAMDTNYSSNSNSNSTNNMNGKGVDRVLFSQEQIASRVKEIGAQISRDYAGTKFVLVGILKGCYHFLSDLSRHITIPHQMDTIGVTTYDGTKSSHSINLYHELDADVTDKHVLLVEDLVDTAFTLNWVLNSYFVQKKRGYASLNVCCLLDKFQSRKVPNYQFAIKPFIRYIGFQIENVHVFVVGYGMDYNQNYRSLPFIGTLKINSTNCSMQQLRTKSPVPIPLPSILTKSMCLPVTNLMNNSMPSAISAACTIIGDGNSSSFAMNENGTVNDDTGSLISNTNTEQFDPFNWNNLNAFDNVTSTTQNVNLSPIRLKVQRYECSHCDRTFVHQSNLTVHMKMHSASAHVCNFCGKKFARLSNLRQHKRVHTNERPFKCRYCEKSFKQHHSLADHIRTHTGEKPFKCEFCSKGFAARCNLIVHRRIHTGERPYECHECGKQYASKSGYNAHIKKYHSSQKQK